MMNDLETLKAMLERANVDYYEFLSDGETVVIPKASYNDFDETSMFYFKDDGSLDRVM